MFIFILCWLNFIKVFTLLTITGQSKEKISYSADYFVSANILDSIVFVGMIRDFHCKVASRSTKDTRMNGNKGSGTKNKENVLLPAELVK